ncbi:MAG: hypothetical protein QOF61_333 [Acidobacteriota bacterium]|nr:hypothetical protein [Acidobacteriota bacterium]
MSCKHFRNEIEESERTMRLGAEASAHVAACGSCREFRAGHESLRRLVGGLERVDAPPDFEFRLRARIARAEGTRDAGFVRRSFVPGAAWLAVAGCAVLALGMFVQFRQARVQAPPSQTESATANTMAGMTSPQTPQTAATATSADETTNPVVEQSNSVSNDSRSTSRSQNPPRRGRFVLPNEAVHQLAASQLEETPLGVNNLSVQPQKIYVGSPIALPVTPDRPLEALFKDAQGASRIVSVAPVTFGARSLPSQRTRTTNVSYSQGVW